MFVYNISLFYVNLGARLTKNFQIEAKTPDFFIKNTEKKLSRLFKTEVLAQSFGRFDKT